MRRPRHGVESTTYISVSYIGTKRVYIIGKLYSAVLKFLVLYNLMGYLFIVNIQT